MLRFKKEDGSNYPNLDKILFKNVFYDFQYGMNSAAISYDGENKYIRITDIDEISHKYLYDNVVSPSGNLEEKYLVSKNDILFARTGASVGKTYSYDEKDGKLYFAGFLIRGNVKETYNSKYIFYQTLTKNYKEWVKKISVRSGQPGINANEYASYSFIGTECIEEQKKIADFLTEIDNVIECSEKEIKSLEQQKKGLIQKIFSQEIRFTKDDGYNYPVWNKCKLGTKIEIERGGSPRPIEDFITVGEGINWIKIGDAPKYGNRITSVKEKIKYEGKSKSREVFKGDLLLSNSMSYGKPYILDVNGCIHDGWLVLKDRNNNFDKRYLCEVLSSEYVIKQYNMFACGSTVHNLNKDIVSNVYVFIPCIEEQKKIADFLSSFDEAIDAAKEELETWKNIKKGLLQQMFE